MESVEAVLRRAAAKGNGTVAMTVATYDYAEGAMLWYQDLLSKSVPSGKEVTTSMSTAVDS